MAEKQGFEPWLEHDPTNGFRNRPLRPLGYFSKSGGNDSILKKVAQGATFRESLQAQAHLPYVQAPALWYCIPMVLLTDILDLFLRHWPIIVSLFLLLAFILMVFIALLVSQSKHKKFNEELQNAMNSSRIYVLDTVHQTVRYFNVMSPSDISPLLPLTDFFGRFVGEDQQSVIAWINDLVDPEKEDVPDFFEIDTRVEKGKHTYFSMLEVDAVDKTSGIIHLQSYLLKSLVEKSKNGIEAHGFSSAKQFQEGLAQASKRKGISIIVRLTYRSIQRKDEAMSPLIMNQVKNALFPHVINRRQLLRLDENTMMIADFHLNPKPEGLRLAKAIGSAISRYLSLNGYVSSIDFRVLAIEHRLFGRDAAAILENGKKASQYAFAEPTKVTVYEKGNENFTPFDDPSSYRTEVERIIHENKVSVKFRPVYDVRKEKIFGYLSTATPINTYFDSMNDLYDYANKTGEDRALLSMILRNTVPTYLSELRVHDARLFLRVHVKDRSFLLPSFSRYKDAAKTNAVFLFDEDDIRAHFDPNNPDGVMEMMREIRAKGYQVAIFLKNAELSLPSNLYSAYDFFVCGFGFAGSATSMDAKIRSKLHSLVEKLLKYRRPIIASDIEGWDAIEIIVRSGLSLISSDAFAPYDPMLNPPTSKSIRKIHDMKS